MCWELLLPAISSKPFFEQAADSSLDYYLGFHSFTERHPFFVYISVYTFRELVTPRFICSGSTRGQSEVPPPPARCFVTH